MNNNFPLLPLSTMSRSMSGLFRCKGIFSTYPGQLVSQSAPPPSTIYYAEKYVRPLHYWLVNLILSFFKHGFFMLAWYSLFPSDVPAEGAHISGRKNKREAISNWWRKKNYQIGLWKSNICLKISLKKSEKLYWTSSILKTIQSWWKPETIQICWYLTTKARKRNILITMKSENLLIISDQSTRPAP